MSRCPKTTARAVERARWLSAPHALARTGDVRQAEFTTV